MSDLMRVGADWGSAGTFKPLTSATSGAQRVSDAHGRYFDAALASRTYFLSGAALAPTAYVGAAAGTPLLAIHNPTNSNKLLVINAVAIALRAAGSAAGQTGLVLWSGVSALPTGTATSPTNVLSQITSGSSARGFSNTALTGSTALAVALPVFTYYWATAAGAVASPGMFDVGGLVVVAPGNQVALGLTTVPTSTTADVAMYWEEVPFLVQV